MTSLAPPPAPLTLFPYDESQLYSELSHLLAECPVAIRTVNLFDPFTFMGGVGQDFDDGLGLDDCSEVYGDPEFDGEEFGP